MRPVDVIIPVYEGYQEVRACIESVLAASNMCEHRVMVIDDASPSKSIKAYLRELAAAGRIDLLVNEKNQGFVETVNRGMQSSPESDVVLLNSDTVVANDWLDRLQCAAAAEDSRATVTPFSNNAEICSFPRICVDNSLPGDMSPRQIDQVLSGALGGESIEIPTAVGFCMYIKRSCLEDVGYFDAELFQLGYGEENDFCLRARRKGWKHVLAADCFVYHAGAVSFSSRKRLLIERAMQILDSKYPGYHAEVASHIEADPAKALRCKGLLEVLRADSRQKVLALTHQIGGGTEKHLRELSDCVDARLAILVLKPVRGSVLRLSLGTVDDFPSLDFDWAEQGDRAALLRLLDALSVGRVHVHHIMGIEVILNNLLETLGRPYDVTLHDYFLIDGNPTLTDPAGMYRPERERRGRGSNSPVFLRSDEELEEWRRDKQRFLQAAERVFLPSRAAMEIYQAVYQLPRALVSWHADMLDVDSLTVQVSVPLPENRPLRVLVLGALGLEKGADLLEEVATLAAGTLLDFTLLGYAYRPLASSVRVLGPYADADLDALIAQQAADLVWFPCRWPETYSYTLSAALRSGLPLLVPNIGSFPERVAGRPLTWVQVWDSSPQQYLEVLESIRGELARLPDGFDQRWQLPAAPRFRYDNDYVLPHAGRRLDADFSLEDVGRHLVRYDGSHQAGLRRRLLLLLLRLKTHPALAWLSRLVPYTVQRAIKRRLSRAPIHEILR